VSESGEDFGADERDSQSESEFGRPSARQILQFFRQTGLRNLLRMRQALVEADKDQDVDADSPELVMLDDRSKALLHRAEQLAAGQREDPAAVEELVGIAGRHRRALQIAALGARQNGQHHDYSWSNRAHRLLQAALTGAPIAPISPDEQARFDLLDEFFDLDPAAQWSELVNREPRLAALEPAACAGKFAVTRRALDLLSLPHEQRAGAARANLRQRQERDDLLRPLVGPKSGQTDVLLGSRLAAEATSYYLDHLAPDAPTPGT
jgi:hypothetical protein